MSTIAAWQQKGSQEFKNAPERIHGDKQKLKVNNSSRRYYRKYYKACGSHCLGNSRESNAEPWPELHVDLNCDEHLPVALAKLLKRRLYGESLSLCYDNRDLDNETGLPKGRRNVSNSRLSSRDCQAMDGNVWKRIHHWYVAYILFSSDNLRSTAKSIKKT